MKRMCTLTLMLAVALTCSAQAVQSATDSVRQAFFNEIEEGLPALAFAHPDSVIILADRLISAMDSSEDSTRLAGLFFDYFSDCPIMGTEAIAVHIAGDTVLLVVVEEIVKEGKDVVGSDLSVAVHVAHDAPLSVEPCRFLRYYI